MFKLPKKIYFAYYILGITVFVYILQNLSEMVFRYDLPVYFGAKINQFIIEGQLWRLITPVLLHGSLIHIGFNMYALYNIGPSLERKYGIWPFLALYLIGGVWGNTLSFLLSPPRWALPPPSSA